ncbi:unnamed protein product [Allacma fusca]|uniref:HMG box domain-containing protein n=1 Tax=Allacma fusca TaxID=39272 RepID=A0A8J2MBN6_9HEXA|nr:unnamed protein product [Allacma fusca]
MTGRTRKGKTVVQAKSTEPSAGPSSSFNMRIHPPGKNKKNSPTKQAPPKRPELGRGKNKTEVKENKVPAFQSESDSESSEDEIPVVKSSSIIASRASPSKVPKLLNDSSGTKTTPKSTPKSKVPVLQVDSESENESSDESEPEERVKSSSPKKVQGVTGDSDSDEDDFIKIPGGSQKKIPSKAVDVDSHRKNLTHELNKVNADESSDSDTDDSTYESPMDEDEDENGLDVPVKVRAKAVPKSVESDPEDIREGSKTVLKMTDDEVSTLLERLEAACPVLDRKASKARAQHINWEDIAFENWDGESCRKAWSYLRQKRRVRRNMWEVVHEVKLLLDKDVHKFRKDIIETFPGYPPKPSGFQGGLNMYAHVKYTEKKDEEQGKINYIEWYQQTVKDYHALSAEGKQVWVDKSARAQAEYQAQLEKFYESIGYKPGPKISKKRFRGDAKVKLGKVRRADVYPDSPVPPLSPMHLFIQSKLDKYEVPPEPEELEDLKIKYGQKWHALGNAKKGKWIGKVIGNIEEYYSAVEEFKKTHEDFEEKPLRIGSGSLLTKAELSLWEATQGRPEKPPASHIDILIDELEESGELDPSKSYDEKKLQAEVRYNKMPWSERERYKVNHRNQVVQYVTSIGQYFSALPEFLRPVLISTVDKKYRHEIAGYAGSDEGSPKKRKRKIPSVPASTDTSASSTKTKKKKVETVNSKDIMVDIEKTQKSLDSSPEAAPTKKKKKSATINEIIRGIFDARQELGRRYSVYYYYARSVAGNETWVTTLDLLGILSTASLILKEFVQLPDHDKITFINHSRNFHAERYYSLKIDPDNTTEHLDEESLEFHGEPKFPPSTPEAFYTSEMRKLLLKSYTSWKDLPEETKNTSMKKFYKATRRYVLDYERFVEQMSSNDLIEYTVSRLKTENLLNKETSNSDFVNKNFIFPLPKSCIADQEDFEVESLVSDHQRIKEQAEAWKVSKIPAKPNGIFNNSTFLAAVAGTLEKIPECTSLQDLEGRNADSETDDSSDSQPPNENPWNDTRLDAREARKNAQRRNKAQLLYNLGDLTSVPFQEQLK